MANIDFSKKKLIAMDLDGTLTQHRTPLGEENRAVLQALSENYKLIMLGAGNCRRIFTQMQNFPIDIIGNYGMQASEYNAEKQDIEIVFDTCVKQNEAEVTEKVNYLRKKYGYTEYAGENVEFHASGMITFPLIGTKAKIEDKLAFDPDRSKRRVFYKEVCELFEGYTVFIGGSSSFDIAPYPYNKYYSLDKYCRDHGLSHEDVIYFGDDYELGGNDEQIYNSDFDFVVVDDYRKFKEYAAPLL